MRFVVAARGRLRAHDLLEEGLSGGPDVGVTLIRSGELLFAEDPAKKAVIAEPSTDSID